jgi:peptide deformylase
MRLKILQVGEPVLRTLSQELSREQILSPEIQNLIEYMRETVRDAPGVGLAASQVHTRMCTSLSDFKDLT